MWLQMHVSSSPTWGRRPGIAAVSTSYCAYVKVLQRSKSHIAFPYLRTSGCPLLCTLVQPGLPEIKPRFYCSVLPHSSRSFQHQRHTMNPQDRAKALTAARTSKGCTRDDSASLYTPRPDDVTIAGHPKSGTTWLRQILHQLRTGGTEDFDNIVDVVPFIVNYKAKTPHELNAEQTASPRVFHTHCLYDDIPKMEGISRFVVIIRDPYDSEYSMMKFIWRMYGFDQDMTPEEYLKHEWVRIM